MGKFSVSGQRPQGLAHSVGFLVTAWALLILVWAATATVLSALLLVVDTLVVEQSVGRLTAGLLYIVALNLLATVLLLGGSRRFARLHWAMWWMILVDALLRFGSAMLRGLDLPRWYGYGFESFWIYDFTREPATWAAGVALGAATAAITLAALSWRSTAAVGIEQRHRADGAT